MYFKFNLSILKACCIDLLLINLTFSNAKTNKTSQNFN